MGVKGWSNVRGSGLVVQGPALLEDIVLTATTAGAAEVTIYDGIDDAGRYVTTLKAPAGLTSDIHFPQGLPVERGIYVVLGSNVAALLISWEK